MYPFTSYCIVLLVKFSSKYCFNNNLNRYLGGGVLLHSCSLMNGLINLNIFSVVSLLIPAVIVIVYLIWRKKRAMRAQENDPSNIPLPTLRAFRHMHIHAPEYPESLPSSENLFEKIESLDPESLESRESNDSFFSS